ncbi:MAG: FAD-dependent oxidoreductase [Candidatus Magasanikbacteria bacterium]
MSKKYDTTIIGGGISGAALLYVLSKYSDIENIALIEKEEQIAMGASNKNNNSQTLHFGDIETNYTLDKAKKVKEAAEMVVNYIENHKQENLYSKTHKMVLAVGEEEVERLEDRYDKFKELFPKLKKARREELKKIEPNLVKQRDEDVPLLALVTSDGYILNYGKLARSFVQHAKESNKDVDVFLEEKVKSIEKNSDFRIKTKKREINTKTIAVAAGGYSLKFAYQLGYGKDLIILPVEGSFFCAEDKVNGKVYMMQDPKLPFAAIHADPDVEDPTETRFGPVSKVLPMLEKRNWRSIIDFFDLFEFRWDAIASLFSIISDPVYLRYVVMQIIYALPIIGKLAYLKEARKIVPSIKYSDLKLDTSIGEIRPQIVNVKERSLDLGEAKIIGDDIIFNITPSPGASVCLQNAKKDAETTLGFLNKDFYKEKFEQKFGSRK